jgi:cytochrome c-type biogenesis protein CcmH/NrfG
MTALSRILNHPLFLALLVAVTLAYFGAGVYSHHREKMQQEAAQREWQAKLDRTRAGESVRIGGYQFLKISEVKK